MKNKKRETYSKQCAFIIRRSPLISDTHSHQEGHISCCLCLYILLTTLLSHILLIRCIRWPDIKALWLLRVASTRNNKDCNNMNIHTDKQCYWQIVTISYQMLLLSWRLLLTISVTLTSAILICRFSLKSNGPVSILDPKMAWKKFAALSTNIPKYFHPSTIIQASAELI